MVGKANQCPTIMHNSDNSTTAVASKLHQTCSNLDAAVPIAIKCWQITYY